MKSDKKKGLTKVEIRFEAYISLRVRWLNVEGEIIYTEN